MKTIVRYALPSLLLALASCAPAGDDPSGLAGPASEELVVGADRLWGRTIEVCWDLGSTQVDRPGETRFTAAREATRQAIARTWSRYTRVRFTGWRDCPRAAPFGDRLLITARAGRSMASVGRGGDNYIGLDLAAGDATAIHEFGHALGFYHEQSDPRTPSTCTEHDNDLRANHAGSIAVSDWDPLSIMNYCNERWVDGVLSPTDIAGAARFYGRRPHDATGDQREDIVFTAPTSLAVDGFMIARSDTDGDFEAETRAAAPLRAYLAQGGAPLAGDFNGDGLQDVALVRGGAHWGTIPVAFATAQGGYRWTNQTVADIPAWSRLAGVQAVVGDFNADGRDDIALAGGATWGTTPVALSLGDGRFARTNPGAPSFAVRARQPGAQLVAGDFDGDGYADLALTGGAGWTTIPVRLTRTTGAGHQESELAAPDFAVYATQGARALAGDFNGDGKTDLALTGGAGWRTVPVALMLGADTVALPGRAVDRGPLRASVANVAAPDFALYATQGSTPVVGDFDDDGNDDIALVGGANWTTIPVASARTATPFAAAVTWSVVNTPSHFAGAFATLPGARPITRQVR